MDTTSHPQVGLDLGLWLLTGMAIKYTTKNITTSASMILPYDHNRYSISIPFSTTNVIAFTFADQPQSNMSYWVSQSSAWLSMNRNDVGEAITLPMWALVSSSTIPVTIMSTSYDPKRRAIYEHIVNQSLSQFGAPGGS